MSTGRPGAILRAWGRRRSWNPKATGGGSGRGRCASSPASRSTSHCRRCAPPAVNRSEPRPRCAHRAGRSSPSSRRPIASGSAPPSPTIPDPALLSMQAIADPPAYERARAAVCYDDVSRILIHGLKYSDRLDLAPMLGRWMARAGHALLQDAEALVPVPLHWRRLWARRFNQSAALAKIVSQASGVPLLGDALKRVKATLQQVGLTASERALNVQGGFAVADRSRVAGRRLILIDDVLTSGATIDACARALNRAGAARVDVLVFARVVNIGRSPI